MGQLLGGVPAQAGPFCGKRSGIGGFGRRVLGVQSERICVSDLPFILLRLASYLIYFGTKSLSETFIWTKKIRAGFLTFSRHFGSGSGWRARPQKWKSAKIHECRKYLSGSSQFRQRATVVDPWWIPGTLMTYRPLRRVPGSENPAFGGILPRNSITFCRISRQF